MLTRSSGLGAAAGVLLLSSTGCDVEWGGGRIALENPAPPDTTPAVAADAGPDRIPLQEGPLLYLVGPEPEGSAAVTPLAALREADGLPSFEDLAMPDGEDPSYRARFDSVFMAPGTELELHALGARIGTVVLAGPPAGGETGCPSVSRARILVVPGQPLPSAAFAWAREDGALPVRVDPPEITRSMQVAGPVLAERLIGGDRAFLARRAAMTAVRLAGDTLPGMAATYLISDSLAAGPPGRNAVSLFFLARFEPARGFIPIWQEIRRYDDPGRKEAFAWMDQIHLRGTRVDALRRYDATSVRIGLGVDRDGGDRGVDWHEPEGCEALGRVEARR